MSENNNNAHSNTYKSLFSEYNSTIDSIKKQQRYLESIFKPYKYDDPIKELIKDQQAIRNSLKIDSLFSTFREQKALFANDKIFGFDSPLKRMIKDQQTWQAIRDSIKIGSLFSTFQNQQNSLFTGDKTFGFDSPIEKMIKDQQTWKSFFNSYATRNTLNNIQKQLYLFPQELQDQLAQVATEASHEIITDHEVQAEVIGYFDTSSNTNKQKKFSDLAIVIILIILELFSNQIQNIAFEFYIKPKIEQHFTPQEVQKTVKCEIIKNDLSSLYGQRITIKDVNLRIEPKQSAELIETIEPATLLHIIDEPNLHKSWLKVEIQRNGDVIQGYLLRRYTSVIKA
jgi:hypothetical protein